MIQLFSLEQITYPVHPLNEENRINMLENLTTGWNFLVERFPHITIIGNTKAFQI